MKAEKNIDFLKTLGHIKKVDAPEFLLTRIKQKIANTYANSFSPRIAWSMATGFVIIVVLNIGIAIKTTPQNNKETTIVEAMNLLPTNALYK
ncbi:MAG: hypothetical protein JNL69_04615 [Bacteroidia bacterium]|nr:hypothetical protein [Bacteroidia bacterium]